MAVYCARMKAIPRIFARAFPFLFLAFCSCDIHKKLADLDYNEGVRKYEAGDSAGASNDFTRAIIQNPNRDDAYIYRGIICHGAGDYTQAIKDYEKAIAIDPQDAVAYNDLGTSQEAFGKMQEAITNYSKAIELDPNYTDAYIARASARGKLQDWDGALADFHEVESLHQVENPDLYQSRAYVQFVRNEFELAITDATKAISLATNGDGASLQIRGLARMRLKDYDNALSDLDAAIKIDPKDPEAFATRGRIKETKGDLQGAKLDVATAMKLQPTNLTAMGTLEIIKLKSDDLPGALAMHLKGLEYSPKSPDTFQFLGLLQYNSSQYPEAGKSFRKAVELDEKNYYARFWIWSVRTRLGEPDEATRELSANLKTRGEDGDHKWELCIGRFLIGDLSESDLIEQASKTAKRPTDVSGHQCEAHYYSGIKDLLTGNQPGAIDHFRKCVATGEDNYPEYFSAKIELRKAEH